MATVKQKSPSEQRILPFHFAARIPAGVDLVSASGFISRKSAGTTTQLFAGSAVEAATLQLKANPFAGALLIVDLGGAAEETFKVISVSGASQPFICTLSHTAEFAHSVDANVSYEPGETANLLLSATATVDIPNGDAFLTALAGADSQTYRVSCLAALSNGETEELELDLQVVEFAPAETQTVQVDEVRDFAYGFDDPLDLVGTTLSSAVAFASRSFSALGVETLTTQIAAGLPVVIGATAVSLADHPGVGALLIVGPSTTTQEKWKVSAVSAGPPYSCTITPKAAFAHSALDPVTYEPGTTIRLLSSINATILGTEAIVRKRRGAAGKTYRLTILGTLGNGEIRSHAIYAAVVES